MRRIPIIIVILLGIFLMACGGNRQLTATQQQVPEWVNSRPINPNYYIGVGSADKRLDPMNFAETAKKNALSSLASEIRVTVRSESFLNTMQVNTNVQEAYNQTIATTSNEDIEGFEVVDVFETPNEYFIYYRLSRARHEQIRNERKMSAMRSAFDHLEKGREHRNRANVTIAADSYLRGLLGLTNYWNEANRWNDDGREIFLDNTLYREFREMIADISITANLDQIELNAANGFREEVLIRAEYNGLPLRGLKLQYTYDNGRFRNQLTGETDNNGILRIPIERVNMNNRSNVLNVRVENDQFRPSDLERRLVNPITEGLRTTPLVLPIVTVMPVVHVTSDERNLGASLQGERLATPLRNRLIDSGFRFTTVKNQADYFLEVNGNTREGGTAQGFHVAYLDMTITVRDTAGKIRYQNTESNIKGLQLNFEAAGIEAYRTAVRRIERELAEALVNAVL